MSRAALGTVRMPRSSVLPSVGTRACDVLVVGGGPAGSTIATLLAEKGYQVALLEKARHPRFHIGESLLPANLPLFDRLGIGEQVAAIGMQKWGVELVSSQHAHRGSIDFAAAWDKSMPYAWQVRRSELDELLFRNAARHGAWTHEGCRVRDVAFDDDGAQVQAERDDGARLAWRTRFVVDASGRDTFLANRLRSKVRNPRHGSAALFGHFIGAERLPGKQEGNISLFWFPHGWFWSIPLPDGTTSVGAVCWPRYLKSRQKPLREFFADTIAMSPELSGRLKDATLIGDTVHATGNYSYSGTHCVGDRYLMLGDAFAFVDPVFSSGVYLAMHSAFTGAQMVAATLDRSPNAAALRRHFERESRRGPELFSWFIFRFTNPTMRQIFMYPRNRLRMQEAVTAVLAGDIFRSPLAMRLSLLLFKILYYVVSAAHPRRSYAAWKVHRANIRDVGPVPGETIISQE